ncbi:hypothetical protein F971_03111 [Acinetobacter vivianii]|uniref:Uncharacterized protein n=1 Tax=Acinetobacter vivianii TaxID=1776742 RepID=N8W5B2_9GAMM|nr:hypothetical protein [Acinetobacter vivianii]ENU92018.1 hypothetical protein F971_03111 [Acinetobacter vivianii]
MKLQQTIQWVLDKLKSEGCLYQDDVVDYLVKNKIDEHLKENADGNLVLHTSVINAFRKVTEHTIVWVKPERYWRYRVPEDEPVREARG